MLSSERNYQNQIRRCHLKTKDDGMCNLMKLKQYLENSIFERYNVQKWQKGKKAIKSNG